MAAITGHHALDDLDADSLEHCIQRLILSYQRTRSTLTAWSVVQHAQALCSHPDFEGSDEDRCAWHRTSSHWRWLAEQGRRSGFAEDAA